MKNEYSETFYVRSNGDRSVGIDPWFTQVELNLSQLPCDRDVFEQAFKEFLEACCDDGFRIEIETNTERDARESAENEQWEAERAAGLHDEPQIVGLKDVFATVFGGKNDSE